MFFLFSAQGFFFAFAFHLTLLQSQFINISTFGKVVKPQLNLCSVELSHGSKHELRIMQILDILKSYKATRFGKLG